MRLPICLLLLFCLASCDIGSNQNDKGPLPILGEKKVVDGETVYHTISDFEFMDQDSNVINNAFFDNQVYVLNNFFTHCPTICPKIKQQMLRVYEKYNDDDRVALLSHTIDPERDSVPRLKVYANRLEVESRKWHFITGKKDELYAMSRDHFLTALEDSDAEGGFDHSGTLILVDKNRMVRSFCNGLKPEEVDRLLNDIDKLLNEG